VYRVIQQSIVSHLASPADIFNIYIYHYYDIYYDIYFIFIVQSTRFLDMHPSFLDLNPTIEDKSSSSFVDVAPLIYNRAVSIQLTSFLLYVFSASIKPRSPCWCVSHARALAPAACVSSTNTFLALLGSREMWSAIYSDPPMYLSLHRINIVNISDCVKIHWSDCVD